MSTTMSTRKQRRSPGSPPGDVFATSYRVIFALYLPAMARHLSIAVSARDFYQRARLPSSIQRGANRRSYATLWPNHRCETRSDRRL